MTTRIAIVGAGAVGSNVGALLTRAGHDVTLIEGWPSHVEAMRHPGLSIEMQEESFRIPVRACHLFEVCTLNEQFDVVLLQCKSYDTLWMAELVKPYLASDAVVVSVQNSINEEWLIPAMGDRTVLGCVLTISCELWVPGHAKRNSAVDHVSFTVGEPHGHITPAVSQVADILSAAGETKTTTNLFGARWSKLVLNSMDMPVAALTGQTARQVLASSECVRACTVLGSETLRVGAAAGFEPEAIFGLSAHDFQDQPVSMLNKLLTALAAEVRDARGAHWYDLMKGRRTEIDYLNGLVVAKGRQWGIATPANERIAELIHALERQELEPQISNLELLEPALHPPEAAHG